MCVSSYVNPPTHTYTYTYIRICTCARADNPSEDSSPVQIGPNISSPHLGRSPVRRRVLYQQLWVWYLCNALKVFWQLPLGPEHHPCFYFPGAQTKNPPPVHVHVNTLRIWSWCPGDGPHQTCCSFSRASGCQTPCAPPCSPWSSKGVGTGDTKGRGSRSHDGPTTEGTSQSSQSSSPGGHHTHVTHHLYPGRQPTGSGSGDPCSRTVCSHPKVLVAICPHWWSPNGVSSAQESLVCLAAASTWQLILFMTLVLPRVLTFQPRPSGFIDLLL